ncbi:MAG: 4-hydroxythreonine-4-phosphate dehydrogenase PdxA [Tannerella sp.]|jgi:4-hydroxythreonine-4-phosphate dehydrogenase|nr:4-hydroxythreonine-4-phosphate dehydrogenase PdxA [Tannerella sp.]
MKGRRLIKAGITHGDTNGVGYEVILKTFADERIAELCTPVIYGSLKIALHHQRAMSLPAVNFNVIGRAEEAVEGKVNLINCLEKDVKVELAHATPEAGAAACKSLEAAVADLKKGAIDTLLTAPINKHNIWSDAFPFPGHTEYLEHHFKGRKPAEARSLMILMQEQLRVALVTGHIPLGTVASQLTKELIVEKLKIFNASLKQDFAIVRPRIAVLSLNPHAGDQGLLGSEEEAVIRPAIAEAEACGATVFGPYPSDGFFGSSAYTRFDGILAMYHDQGLIPFKILAMENGVNYTAGLPAVRTSPAHGTAYDIAGRNKASEESFRRALFVSLDIFRNREIHRDITANPLPKQYVDGGADNVKLDLTKEDTTE